MHSTRPIACFDDADVARQAAGLVFEALVRVRGRDFGLALSGGRIAPVFFGELLRQAVALGVELARIDFFWADERCVPPDHADSNYRVFRETFLSRCPVPESRLHRLCGELPPAEGAIRATADWQGWLARRGDPERGLDCVILGVGEDGHVASLFPENREVDLRATEPFRAVTGSKPPPQRLTMGYPLLWSAAQGVVLATGTGKGAVVRGSLEGSRPTPLAEVLRVREARGLPTQVLAPAATFDAVC